MKTHPGTRRSSWLGITLRTALLSWLVTIGTLLVFVSVIIPLQKETLLENLRSKALAVVASLHDVAAGAAINEDYSSVVDHCKETLQQDKSISYLVVTKNNGFSLVCYSQDDQPHFRVEQNTPTQWHPAVREPFSGIGVVSLVHRRVFHYSQPFDYSGIQWGWIHVGLSLNRYEQSVAAIYHRTVILVVLCIAFSLGASVVYAKRLVRPILSLQTVVREVAGGDLSARAVVDRSDELGALAGSVNSMTEALRRRDRILQSVRFAAQQFLSTPNWRAVIDQVLATLGEAAGADRVCVLENQVRDDGEWVSNRCSEWRGPGATVPSASSAEVDSLPWRGDDLGAWRDRLQRGDVVMARVRELEEPVRSRFAGKGIQSLILIPVMAEGVWWGALKLDACRHERQWTDAERHSLRAAADMLGAGIARQRIQDALVEAKETLEQRVWERTRELQEQVLAKEKALADLAETQHRLIDASRQAGMAEVATGVLHNVGNVLNSVNVSTTLVRDSLRRSRVPTLLKLADLIADHADDLASYVTTDPRGKLVPSFLSELAHHLNDEQQRLQTEHEQLARNVEHIKEIVAMQQTYAKVSGFREQASIASLIEDALKMNLAGLTRDNIRVIRHFAEVPPINVDKHKVLQILINLVRNAIHALRATANPDKQIAIDLHPTETGRIQVVIEDNGIGIAPEHLTQVFSHGFTTRKDGHGFGLHSGANAAKEMGGRLEARSDGVGQGATFTLELPLLTATDNADGH